MDIVFITPKKKKKKSLNFYLTSQSRIMPYEEETMIRNKVSPFLY